MTKPTSKARGAPFKEESRSDQKQRAIIQAATTTFLRNGYLGTSMDDIAALARVSKQTVYKHFSDKEGLFREVVLSTIDQVAEPFFEDMLQRQDPKNLENDLRELARRLIAIVIQPRVLDLRRLVIAEAGRFPKLGHTYYERGPKRTIEAMAAWFQKLAEGGHLRLDDPLIAANHFNWLVSSIPLNEIMFLGNGERFSTADLERFADAGVRVFLAAYGRSAKV